MDSNDRKSSPIVLNNKTPDIVKGFFKWPFEITKLFYTRKEGTFGDGDEKKDFILHGLMSRPHISGFIYEILENMLNEGVKATATLIQEKDPDNEAVEAYRIDMNLLDAARYHCNGGCSDDEQHKKCRSFEFDIAKLFLGKKKAELESVDISSDICRVCETFYYECPNCPNRLEAFIPEKLHIGRLDSEKLYGYIYNCPLTGLGGIAIPLSIMSRYSAVLILGQFAWDKDHKAELDKKFVDIAEYTARIKSVVENSAMHLKERIKERIDRHEKSLSIVVQRLIRESFAVIDNQEDSSLDIAHEMVRNDIFPLLEEAYSLYNIGIYYRTSTDRDRLHSTLYSKYCLHNEDEVKPAERNAVACSEKGNGGCVINSILEDDFASSYTLHYFRSMQRYSVMDIDFRFDKELNDHRKKVLKELLEPIASELYSQFIERIRIGELKTHYDSLRFMIHELGTQQASGIADIHKLKQINRRFIKGFCQRRINDPTDRETFYKESRMLDTVLDDNEYVYRRIGTIALSSKPSNETGIEIEPKYFNIYSEIFNALAANYRILLFEKDMTIRRKDIGRHYTDRVFGDSQYLQMSVNNLFNNAQKYGYRGTNVYYSCVLGEDPDTHEEAYVIEVENYGELIEEGNKEKIFDDGFRNKHGAQRGMGYGLHFVKTIAEKHGGKVTVSSKVVSKYPLPYLYTMRDNLEYDEGHVVDENDLYKEIKKWEGKRDQYREIVNKEQRASMEDIDPYTLFEEYGNVPTAKTVFTLYLPVRR